MASTHLIIGLGNPGDEYGRTRHNIGRLAVEAFAASIDAGEWERDSKAQSLVASGVVGKSKAFLALPETYMNKSGIAAAYLAKIRKVKPEHIIVVQDEMDLPVGSIKIVFDRGSGGHRGVESIAKALKTLAFVRVRIGVSPSTPTGKLRKPSGEDKIVAFLVDKPIKDDEFKMFKKVFKKTNEALATILEAGRDKAMNVFNS
jgi:PTH1 family peptidyl-tRNA hydrolase